jgi:periplasmic protein TonB
MEILPFGLEMTRPARIAGQDPVYTREALEARIEGLTIVKCVITSEGTAQNCRMIKALPHMEKAVLEALATQKFKPVTFQGRPVSVDYVFNIRLVLPRH